MMQYTSRSMRLLAGALLSLLVVGCVGSVPEGQANSGRAGLQAANADVARRAAEYQLLQRAAAGTDADERKTPGVVAAAAAVAAAKNADHATLFSANANTRDGDAVAAIGDAEIDPVVGVVATEVGPGHGVSFSARPPAPSPLWFPVWVCRAAAPAAHGEPPPPPHETTLGPRFKTPLKD